MLEKLGITVKTELELYLVDNSFKPATRVIADEQNINPEYVELIGNNWTRIKKLRQVARDKIKSWLGARDYAIEAYEPFLETFDDDGTLLETRGLLWERYIVGGTPTQRQALMEAQTNQEIGLAFGYPIDATEAFQKFSNGTRHDGATFQQAIYRAVGAGVEVPSWLAYINHVPAQIDLVSGVVSPSSEELGKKYERFVRGENPELTARVDAWFEKVKIFERAIH